eukprot:gene16615-19735_t
MCLIPFGNQLYAQNINPLDYLSKKVNSLSIAGSHDVFTNGYTFAYSMTGAPWNGAFMSFGGFDNSYDCQFSTDYGTDPHMSFRTRNGDAGVWNRWSEIYHNNNLNRIDIDFKARNINGENLSLSGNIALGTSDVKGYKLAVNGKVRAQEIKVETANWPDYVFAKDYQLPSLKETEKHIQDNGHLPGIPSASEVKNNGVDLGEMNAKLLQKIEELTLHLIDMEKKNDALTNRVLKLEKQK